MEKIDSFVERKRWIASNYLKNLKGVRGLKFPCEMPWAKNAFWLYSILVEKEFGTDRDKLIEKLHKQGVESRPLLQPMHRMLPYATRKRFPVAEHLAKEGISLPSGVSLSKRQIAAVCNAIKKIANDFSQQR